MPEIFAQPTSITGAPSTQTKVGNNKKEEHLNEHRLDYMPELYIDLSSSSGLLGSIGEKEGNASDLETNNSNQLESDIRLVVLIL